MRPAPNGFARTPRSTRRSSRASARPVESALLGAFDDWRSEPRPALANVLVLDQFTRNVFRDTPRAFAGDDQALATAIAAVDAGLDGVLDTYERWFLYLPFEHAET